MKRDNIEAIIKMAADLWLDCDDHQQAMLFNLIGKEYTILHEKVGWTVERQLCAAVQKLDEHGKVFCKDIAEFLNLKEGGVK